MKIKNVLGTVVSGFAVYYVMAACSAGAGGTSSGDNAGGSTSSGAPGTSSGASGASGSTSGSTSGSSGASSGVVPNAMADTWHVSGSRLKIRYYEATDGARQFLGWYDTQRKEDCNVFTLPNPGAFQCVPGHMMIASTSFKDAGCTVPLGVSLTGTEKYIRNGAAFAERGALHTGGIYNGKPGSCVAGPPIAGFTYWDVGTAVPSDAFVSFVPKTEP